MPEALHEKLLELQQELDKLIDLRQQMEEHGNRSAAIVKGASESLASTATILERIDRLTGSIEALVDKTDDIDFPSWLKKLDEVVRHGLDAVSIELNNATLAATKTIQDEYSVIRADQKAAQERLQVKLEDIRKNMTGRIEEVQHVMRDMDAKHEGLITGAQQEVIAHGENAAKNAKAITRDLSRQESTINALQQDLSEMREGLSKKLTLVMTLVIFALVAGAAGVLLQFLQ